MKQLYSLALCLILFCSGYTQVRFTSVDLNNNEITIMNMGNSAEDISNLQLCSLFDYEAFNQSNISIVSGDLMLDPGESVTVSWTTSGMNPAGSDLGLYNASAGFSNPANMLDFVQWGSAGNGREGVADAAGLWTAGEFISTGTPFFFSGGAGDFGNSFWSSNPPSNSGPCTDLFFSEYIEGSGNNKAIEVYNPTSSTVDLSNYQILRFANGGTTPGSTFNFPVGTTLASGDVWLSVNGQADAALTNIADEDTSATTFFNGDDTMVLINVGTGDTLDIIGIVGNDPGTNWPVGSGSTANNTLVRMSSVQEGTTDWSLSATQWDVLPQNDFSNAGSHVMIPCGDNPVVGFSTAEISVEENVGSVNVEVSLLNNNGSPVDVTASYNGGSATDAVDFTQMLPMTISFAGDTDESMSFSITIIDDMIAEGAETIELVLSNPTGDAELNIETLIITINASDMEIPTYDIGEINNVDMNGVADSVDVECKIVGTVYGVNLRPAGLQFTMHDGTGGIGIFNATGDLGYTVNEGDEIRLIGSVSQFNGLTQMNPDSIVFISSGNPLNPATVITTQDESGESELIRIECVTLDDPSQWSPSGSGFNVDVSNDNGSYVVRIDADVDLFNAPAPTGTFTVTGIGGQFDSSSPFDSGYQLLPRYSADIDENDPLCVTPPANDACDDAIDITDLFVLGSTQESDIFTNEGAGVNATDPLDGFDCFGEPDGGGSTPSLENNVWFTFNTDESCTPLVISSILTTDCNGTVTDYIDDGDTQMALYSGTCGNLVPVDCNEDSPNSTNGNLFAELINVPIQANTDYYLMVDGFSLNGSNSDGEFCIQVLLDCSFSTSELEDRQVSAYPNPGNGMFIIETETSIENIQVFNALGQEVTFESYRSSGKIELDLTANDAGIYQVVLTNQAGSTSLQYVFTK